MPLVLVVISTEVQAFSTEGKYPLLIIKSAVNLNFFCALLTACHVCHISIQSSSQLIPWAMLISRLGPGVVARMSRVVASRYLYLGPCWQIEIF